MKDFNVYNPDSWAEEVSALYDELDRKGRTLSLESLAVDDDMYDLVSSTWEMESEEILNDLGFGSSGYEIRLLPSKKLKTLMVRFKEQNVEIDDYGQVVSRDPLPDYVPKTDNVRKELYSLGRTLGLMGDLGRYYYLIPDINFSRGLWLGQVEKAISENDLEGLNQVKADMEFFKAGSSDAEFERINKAMYKLAEDNQEDVSNSVHR